MERNEEKMLNIHGFSLHAPFLFRVFVIWNPPLKFGAEEEEVEGEGEGENAEEERGDCSLPTAADIVSLSPDASSSGSADLGPKVYKHVPSILIADPAVKPMDVTGSSGGDETRDSLSLFLEGCEDRPSTLSAHQVGYHRGWNRSGKRAGMVGKKSKWDADWEGEGEDGVIRRPLALAPADRPNPELRKSGVKMNSPDKTKVRYSSSGGFYQRPRVSSIGEMAQLLSWMVKLRVRTLAFCGVRKLVELVLEYSLKNLKGSSSTEHLAECVGSYRGLDRALLHHAII